MSSITDCKKLSLPQVIKKLEQEKNQRIVELSKELAGVIQNYDTKIEGLREVLHLKENGQSLTRKQYIETAKRICPMYWIGDIPEIKQEQPICANCDSVDTRCTLQYSKPEFAGRLVL